MGLFDLFRGKKAPPKPALKENRLAPRWKLSCAIKVKFGGSNDYIDCEIRDLNMKGFSLILPVPIPEGCTNAELYFNEKFIFNIEMTIVWHREAESKYIYGMKFTRLRDLDKEKIFQMMKENHSDCICKSL